MSEAPGFGESPYQGHTAAPQKMHDSSPIRKEIGPEDSFALKKGTTEKEVAKEKSQKTNLEICDAEFATYRTRRTIMNPIRMVKNTKRRH
eukprot:TRINITY_DN369_c0_g1_i1.p1 TRINITY_DN369_c0_g1~~TRINITY_DN369_c0_g1_i1.p1  ORF type:complete len:90 (+),score=9.45 TRINITY_DN369_c0_g1_i1:941-1210(+)